MALASRLSDLHTVTVKQTLSLTVEEARILKYLADSPRGYAMLSDVQNRFGKGRIGYMLENDLVHSGTGGIPVPPPLVITVKGREALEQLAPLLAQRP